MLIWRPDSLREKMNYKELWEEGTQLLTDAGVPEARLDAWYLLEYCTGITRAGYWLDPARPVCDPQAGQYKSLLVKRAQRIPLQQITHQAFFMGYEFYVDEHVLIPRQDTEILAETALSKLAGVPSPRILDLCTGSGCILLSLLAERKDARGLGTDLSPEALAVAKENAARLGAADRCSFSQGDLFGAVPAENLSVGDSHTGRRYDMIVSNPPYIPSAEIAGLDEEVRLHDPRTALDGGEGGLDFYRRITLQAGDFLAEGGWLVLETGWDQGDPVAAMLREAGYEDVEIIKDLAGLDRVAAGRRTGGTKNV